MHTDELVLPMVKVVGSFAKVEIDDVDGIDFLHLIVFLTEIDVLRDSLCNAINNTMEIVQLSRLLNLHKDDFVLGILGFDVNAVELVVGVVLVALAFQNLNYLHLLIQKDRHQALQNAEVGLVSQHTLGSPVKTDIFVHGLLLFS